MNTPPAGGPPSPLKWHGGKSYLAGRIAALMPPHTHYVEPFAGGLSVLLAKDPEGVSEAVNDLDGGLCNFWRVLQGEETFARLQRRLQTTPFSEPEWHDARGSLDAPGPVDRAAAFFVHCRQSLAGRRRQFAPLSRTRTRRGMNEQASAWTTAVEGLPAVHARLMRVAVLGPQPALDVVRGQDGSGTLFYLDPPYLHETRATTREYGPCEMTAAGHAELLDALAGVRGKVMLSGYRSGLYDRLLAGWTLHTFEMPNNAAGGRAKRTMTECLWCNF
jgi:DNA adenine methylase